MNVFFSPFRPKLRIPSSTHARTMLDWILAVWNTAFTFLCSNWDKALTIFLACINLVVAYRSVRVTKQFDSQYTKKKAACEEALRLAYAELAFALQHARPLERFDPTPYTAIELNSCYDALLLSVKRKDVIERFLNIMKPPKPVNPMMEYSALRKAIRKELGYKGRLRFNDRDRILLGRLAEPPLEPVAQESRG